MFLVPIGAGRDRRRLERDGLRGTGSKSVIVKDVTVPTRIRSHARTQDRHSAGRRGPSRQSALSHAAQHARLVLAELGQCRSGRARGRGVTSIHPRAPLARPAGRRFRGGADSPSPAERRRAEVEQTASAMLGPSRPSTATHDRVDSELPATIAGADAGQRCDVAPQLRASYSPRSLAATGRRQTVDLRGRRRHARSIAGQSAAGNLPRRHGGRGACLDAWHRAAPLYGDGLSSACRRFDALRCE